MRLFLSISYDGAAYCGWQRQDNAVSVQEVLEKTVSTVFGCSISVTGAGRTDAGVNATHYIARFDVPEEVSNPSLALSKINAILPHDIAAHHLYAVGEDAHARFDATSRTYRYYIHTAKAPFACKSWFCKYRLDVDAMNRAAEYLLGTNDFSSFDKSGTDNATAICTVTNARWTRIDETHLVFEITANRFLRNMVRAIVGTLVDVGRGKIGSGDIVRIVEARDRCRAGQSVPGHALFLCKVEYPWPLLPL